MQWYLSRAVGCPAVVAAVVAAAAARRAPPEPTRVVVELGQPSTPLKHFWKASVGSGHAKLGLRDDWRKQLHAVHTDLGITGVRFHGTFDDDMGPVVIGTAENPVYNFSGIDMLYDGIRAAGITPIIELSFMPTLIANCTMPKCRTTMHYQGVTVPPKAWSMWQDLVTATAKHMVERYTLDVVASFKFEVWNEMWGMDFGDGQPGTSPYMAMYNASYHALKSVSPRLQIGGPATAEVKNVADFVAALKVWGVDADFVSTHLYPTDWCNFEPDARTNLDCFTDTIVGAREQARGYPFLMTEYNCGWKNSQIHDGESYSYAAAFAFRTVNKLRGQVDALSWWTFSSIFEEGGLPTNEFGPFGANSAMQSVHGVPLPIYRGFELLASAGNVTVPVTIDGKLSPNGTSTMVSVMATTELGGGPTTVFISNFAPDDGRGAISPPLPPAPGQSCDPEKFLPDTDFPGNDLLPEGQKFSTPNASACCEACKNYQVDKFCAVWVWGVSGGLKRCYLKSAGALPKRMQQKGFTAGYPGAPPPPPSDSSWYNTTRIVQLTVDATRLASDERTATVSTINSTCSNPKALWLATGSPTWPSDDQINALNKASQLCVEHTHFELLGNGQASLTLSLEAYAAVSVSFGTTVVDV